MRSSGLAQLALLSAMALLLAGCSEVQQRLGAKPQAGVGDALTLEVKRIEDSEVVAIPLEVELLELHDPAEPEASAPRRGDDRPTGRDVPAAPGPDARLVAVELRVTNLGEAVYRASLSARLAAGDQQAGQAPSGQTAPAERQSPVHVTVTECDELRRRTPPPGDTTTGCLAFAVADGHEPHTLRMAPVGDTGEWNLGS